jgi:tRNA(Ile)-lysidine synthase
VKFRVPGEFPLGTGWSLRAELSQRAAGPVEPSESAWEAWLDADVCGQVLLIRRPRAGDRFQPLGMDGHTTKLSDFWINHKLPRRARADWPLVCSGDQIAWLPGYRLGHAFRVTPNTRHVLHLLLIKPSL